ncbi:MAG: hypothetical protein C6Y20_12545 [Tagaea sp. CACIAM 22H2]|nr:hypothetical protein [Tagaea sp. CACIAM 22H2]
MLYFFPHSPSRLPSLGALLYRTHRYAFDRLSILPIAAVLYWLVFVLSGDAVWKSAAAVLTEQCDPWFGWIVPFWDSLPRRYAQTWSYPIAAHARHILAVAWLSIYGTILLSFAFMPAFVRTAIDAGRKDPAMAYSIRMIALTAWLVFVLILWLSSQQGVFVRRTRFVGLPLFAMLTEYCTILWICALLAHRQLGDRWRDFKGPS